MREARRRLLKNCYFKVPASACWISVRETRARLLATQGMLSSPHLPPPVFCSRPGPGCSPVLGRRAGRGPGLAEGQGAGPRRGTRGGLMSTPPSRGRGAGDEAAPPRQPLALSPRPGRRSPHGGAADRGSAPARPRCALAAHGCCGSGGCHWAVRRVPVARGTGPLPSHGLGGSFGRCQAALKWYLVLPCYKTDLLSAFSSLFSLLVSI